MVVNPLIIPYLLRGNMAFGGVRLRFRGLKFEIHGCEKKLTG